MAKTKRQKSLDRWTKQKWRTASGKKSSETGEVYAPSKTISKLKSTAAGRKKLAAANRKKRAATIKNTLFFLVLYNIFGDILQRDKMLEPQ